MNKLDTILYEALEEKDVPSKMLNRQILEKADMEEKKMKKNKKKMVHYYFFFYIFWYIITIR